MDRLPTQIRRRHESYTRTADAGIVNGRVEATTDTRNKVWKDWQTHCQAYNVPPYLDGCSFEEVARVGLNFGGMLRQGRGNRRKPVSAGSISTGIGSVATQIGLDRGTRPLHQPGKDKYILPIQHMLAGFKSFDPPTEKKLACHPDLPLFAVTNAYKGKASVVRQAAGDLVCIAFYYLLRIGEYTTKTRRKKKTRTRQFRIKDVTFFKYGKDGKLQPLASDANDKDVLNADAATLRISNQKNGHAGACIHHTAIKENKEACPVRALARRCTHIRQHTKNRSAFICTYFDEVGMGSVTDNQIRFAVEFAAKALQSPS